MPEVSQLPDAAQELLVTGFLNSIQQKQVYMKTLQGKVAIVTGSGSGIGKAAARLFAAEGARVVVSDINVQHGQGTVDEIKAAGGEAIFVRADSSSPEDNENLVVQATGTFGALHIAVNNAGIGGPLGLTGEYPVEGWKKVIDTNLSGVFYALRSQIPAMRGTGGSIINVASILGKTGTRLSPAYVAAKHGVVGLTKAAALEYADKGIRINSIGPGYIKTPMVTSALDEQTMAAVARLHPVGRIGEPEEVAELLLWLASDKASFVTGSYYPVDGGYLAQ